MKKFANSVCNRVNNAVLRTAFAVKEKASKKSEGLDGLIITIGLLLIGLVLILAFKDKITTVINTILTSISSKLDTLSGTAFGG